MKQSLQSTGEVFELLQGYRDKEGNIHKEFEVREMTGSDEEAISKNEIKSNGAKIIRTIIARCCLRIGNLFKEDMKDAEWVNIIQNLSVGDQDYILLRIREASLGEEIEAKYECADPSCKESIHTTITIDELELVPFDGLHEIPFELPKGFVDKDGNVLKKGKMRHPNGLDREVLDSVLKTNVGRANTLMLSRCITELEGVKVYDELVRNLSIKDRNYLLELFRTHKFGVNLEVEVECPTCYNTFKASLNAVNFI